MSEDPSDFRPDGPFHVLLRSTDDWRYFWLKLAFVIASGSHLWLLDAWQPDWALSNGIYVIGLVLIVLNGGALGWFVTTLALAIPLLFLRDQLTQSVLLMGYASSIGVGLIQCARGRSGMATMLTALRGLTIVTYFLATFHKLNHDFFNVATSCANYGMVEVFEYFHVSSTFAESPALPIIVVTGEGLITGAYLMGRRRIAWLIAAGFHIPLTLVMAPAFVFVMAVGHVAFLEEEDRISFLDVFWNHAKLLLILPSAITALSLAIHGAWPEWTMIPREWLLWFVLCWVVTAALVDWRFEVFKGAPKLDLTPLGKAWAWGLSLLFLVNGMLPYSGLQYQHSAAMLSNLRIDEGCWNSLVLPESVRITEDYIRIDKAYFNHPGRLVEYENILKDQLWNPPQMRQMRRNWCKKKELQPLYVEGTYRGRNFVIEDVCSDEPLPFEDDGIFGVELFPEFLRYQKNLGRECPQTCIH